MPTCGFCLLAFQTVKDLVYVAGYPMFVPRPIKLKKRGIIHRDHIEKNHLFPPPKAYRCGTCVTGFARRGQLMRHLRESKAHLDEAYICCQQRMKRKYHFKIHLGKHISGEHHPVTAPPLCACGAFVDEPPDLKFRRILKHIEACKPMKGGRGGGWGGQV